MINLKIKKNDLLKKEMRRMIEIKEVWLLTDDKETDFPLADNLIFGNRTKDEKLIIKERILETLKENKEVIPWIEIKTVTDEKLVIAAAKAGAKNIIVSGKGYCPPPRIAMENIVAEIQTLETKIYAYANSFEEMLSIAKALDIGLNVVVKDSRLIRVFKDYFAQIKFDLKPVKVKSVVFVGAGWRSCIDTTARIKKGEGMLVGPQSNAYFLIHGETKESKFTPPRIFRVNAGGFSNYVVTDCKDDKIKTKYLNELKCGEKVLVVSKDGNARRVLVNRNKIEYRPLSLITTDLGYTILLQEAETVYLTLSNGKAKSILSLKPGDEILMYITKGGMHGGIKIEEGLIEY